MALVGFPSELIVHIIGRIDCWDLVAMCKANPEWEALVEAEGLWRKAARHRWPQVAGGTLPPLPGESADDTVHTAGPGPTPLALPRWAYLLDGSSRWSLPSDYEAIRMSLPKPPRASAPGEAWCRFYLTQDAFELMSIPTDEANAHARRLRLETLKHAMAWCSEYIDTAFLMADDAAGALRLLPGLKALTVASAGDAALSGAAAAISTAGSLERLVAIDSLSTEDHMRELLGALAASAAPLRHLEIATARLREASWRQLVSALWATPTLYGLSSLSLVGCAIGDAQCIDLCVILRCNQRALKHLNLSNNRIGHAAILGGLSVLLSSAPDVAAERVGVAKLSVSERVAAPPRRAQRSIELAAAVGAGEGAGGSANGSARADLPAGASAHAQSGSPSVGSLAPLSIADEAGAAAPMEVELGAAAGAPAARAPELEAQGQRAGGTEEGHGAPGAGAGPLIVGGSGADASGTLGAGGARREPPAPDALPSAAQACARAQRGCALESLDLSLNPLAAEGTIALAECLRQCPTLASLTLQYVTLYSREPANLLGCLLGAELALVSLNLSFNYISACGSPVEQISAQLGVNRTLRELNVRRCCIGGWRRARALARGIMANTSLTSIDLSYNGLGAAQAAQTSSSALSLAVGTLCQAIAKNGSLVSVDLGHNALGDVGSAAVAQAALESSTITFLNLHSNGISAGGLRAITARLGGGRHSWLPVALHAHARHVRIATANAEGALGADGCAPAAAGPQPAEGGSAASAGAHVDEERVLTCSQPYADGGGLFFPWPAPASALAPIGGAQGAGPAGASAPPAGPAASARTRERVALCVDLQGNLSLAELVVKLEDAEPSRPVPAWEEAARAGAARAGAARADAAAGRVAEVARSGMDPMPAGGFEEERLSASAAGLPQWGARRGDDDADNDDDDDDIDGEGEEAEDEEGGDGRAPGPDPRAEPPPSLRHSSSDERPHIERTSRPSSSALAKRKERGWDAAARAHTPAGAEPAATGAEAQGPALSREGSNLHSEEEAMSTMLLRDTDEGEAEAAAARRQPLRNRAPAPAAAPPARGAPALAIPLLPLLACAPEAVRRAVAHRRASLLPNPLHMSRQREVNTFMRRILVDWLLELFEELQLPSHSLLAGVHAVDRYLSIVSVHKESLQLVGAVSLMLCSNNFCKLLSQDGEALELRGLASADDVAYWTDNTYTVDEVTAMEARFMHRLGLGLGSPVFSHRSSLCYLTKYAALLPLTDDVASVAHEILLRSTREYEMLRFEPSLVAATALVIAVRSCQAQALSQQHAAGVAEGSSEGAPGPPRAGRSSPQLLRAQCARDSMPDERTLYACTGHSVAEVRACEDVFSECAVVDSPLACHSVASGLPRRAKSIVVHLVIRSDAPASEQASE